MFGMGLPEIILILVLALIVIGPKKLPDLAKSLGKMIQEFKKATSDLKESMDIEPEMEKLKNAYNDMNEEIKDFDKPEKEKTAKKGKQEDE